MKTIEEDKATFVTNAPESSTKFATKSVGKNDKLSSHRQYRLRSVLIREVESFKLLNVHLLSAL